MGEIVSMDFYHRWMSLYRNIQSRSIKEVAEEAAYTWFNRFMAIRIMEKQDFAPLVLEYESEEVRVPMIVSEARQGRMPQMAQINMQSWMFLSSFEKLRNIFLHNYIIDSMLHLGPRTLSICPEPQARSATFICESSSTFNGSLLGCISTK